MQPIISPWSFYLAAIANKVVLASSLIALGSVFVSIVCLAHEDEEGIEHKTTIKWFIAGIIAMIIAIIVPDGDTVYKMIAANMVTPDNIDMGKDYIIQCIKEAAAAMK